MHDKETPKANPENLLIQIVLMISVITSKEKGDVYIHE